MRAIIEISNFAIDIAPGEGAAARARAAVVAEGDAEVLARGEERIPGRRVVRLDPRLGRREVDALQAGGARELELGDGQGRVPHRQLHEPDVPLRLDRARVGQPLVVHVLTGLQLVEVLLDRRRCA